MTKALRFLAALLALAIALPAGAEPAPRVYTQAELDQMLAPVALYPDPLLSQVLMAATYPLEVAEAARWSRANPGLQGDDAVRAAQGEDWDPSVLSLVAFPQILARMDENFGWTRSLGDAFLRQEPHVMDTVQQLRRRAQAAGNLQSSEQMYVQQQGQIILVQPTSPQYVYVPYYDPLEVYGPWWWPAYRPVVWAPWFGYTRHYRPGISVGFWWGSPIGLSFNFFFGDFDWRQRHARVAYPTAYYYRSPYASGRSVAVAPQRWRHDAQRREAFAERRAVQARQQIQVESSPRRQERGIAATPERAERRAERQATRTQAQPTAPVQAQPQTQAQPRSERREERESARTERRETRQPQAQPQSQVQPQPQPQTQPRSERREERDSARTERREARQAKPQAQPQPQPRPQPEVRPQPQVRAQPEARPQPQARPERHPRMPAAQSTQTPRAERQEQRQERREANQEQRQERGNKGHKDRS